MNRVTQFLFMRYVRTYSSAHAQYITLAFVGCISLSSLRGFLRSMRKVLAFIAKRMSI